MRSPELFASNISLDVGAEGGDMQARACSGGNPDDVTF